MGLSAQAVNISPGNIDYFAANTPPAGWIKANGAAVSRTTYAALFTVIGTTYGVGDGSTTFNVPDLRGEFPRGWDDARGVDSGRAIATAQADAVQGHYHNRNSSGTTEYIVYVAGGASGIAAGSQANTSAATSGAAVTDGTNGTPRTAAETRSRNVALLACIKY